MSILEFYLRDKKNLGRFLKGIRDVHNFTEYFSAENKRDVPLSVTEGEDWPDVILYRTFGFFGTLFGYGGITAFLTVNYGLKGLAPLIIPAVTNFNSYRRHREKERKYREIGEV